MLRYFLGTSFKIKWILVLMTKISILDQINIFLLNF